MGQAASTVLGAVLLANVALAAGVAHSWVVQSGDSPVRLGVDESGLEGLEMPAAGERREEPAREQAGDPVEAQEQQGDGAEQPAGTGSIGFEITVEQAEYIYSLLEAGELVAFLDAREPEEFEAGHVLGAYRLTAEELRNTGLTTPAIELGAISPEHRIVIYCGGGTCEASHNLATFLQEYGYRKLHVMTDGYPEWEAAGLPTETGPDPLTGFGGDS